jgi:predicted secreted protein
MKRLLALSTILLCATTSFAAAASASSTQTAVTITPASSGGTVVLGVGEQLNILLADNKPSTGYKWTYVEKPASKVLKLLSDKTATPKPTQPPTTGAPAPRTIVYRALAVGSTKIVLSYARRGGKPTSTLSVLVRVLTKVSGSS